ncbi:unnamed protein product [Mytilus coruscus]|uniref:TRIM2_3 n=1 Tax=Mytilus coruscus TaxID=42192 RepID=A0A6J8D0Y8_MYTCO|nr:unnamed protein product [Mytilus coruscus]
MVTATAIFTTRWRKTVPHTYIFNCRATRHIIDHRFCIVNTILTQSILLPYISTNFKSYMSGILVWRLTSPLLQIRRFHFALFLLTHTAMYFWRETDSNQIVAISCDGGKPENYWMTSATRHIIDHRFCIVNTILTQSILLPYISTNFKSYMSGILVWRLTSPLLQISQAISADAYGNVFLAETDSNQIVAISCDGGNTRKLLDDKQGIILPSAVYYDKSTKHLLVCNRENGRAFLYSLM